MSLAVVVGLAAEARLLRAWNAHVAIGGGGTAGAIRAAASLPANTTALISFGLAGGLDPALTPGTLIVPVRIVDNDEIWMTDPALCNALGGPTGHILRGGGALLATTADKRAASRTADAVDLESAAVAREARQRGIPFAALRAICDPAHRALPRAALVALDAKGRIGLLRVAATALRHPQELPALIALARDAARARAALLGRVRATAGLHGRA